MFSALGDMSDVNVLDLYAGSGALGIEALSRGARSAVFVERAGPALKCIRANIAALGLGDACKVVAVPVERVIKVLRSFELEPFHLVVVDPPWEDVPKGRLQRALDPLMAAHDLIAPTARLVVEHAARDEPPDVSGAEIDRTKRYGDTALSFYRRQLSIAASQ
jgi:16S rRNA (guanine966-N2)-methyltransferase